MSSTSGAAISLQAVCKQYLNDGQAFTAVDRVDLDVEPSSSLPSPDRPAPANPPCST